jgi:hypothetical protein
MTQIGPQERTGGERPGTRGLFAVAGTLAVLSLGLPWSAAESGAQHPVRVLGPVAAVLLWSAARSGRAGRARAAVLVGALALPLGLSSGLTAGRAAYAVALLLAAMASGVIPRPDTPRPMPGSAEVAGIDPHPHGG